MTTSLNQTAHTIDLAAAKRAGDALAKKKLNNFRPELQSRLNDWVKKYCERATYFLHGNGQRIDYPVHGMLAEIATRTPFRVYDLPELKLECDTAFVDTTSRFYISDTFFEILEREQMNGNDSLFFLFDHEMEHLRRMHTQRMLDFPHELANCAQDIRINCDIITTRVGNKLKISLNRVPTETEFISGVNDYYLKIGKTLRNGWAMNDVSEYHKWRGKSEEAIAAELLKTWKKPDPLNENTDISFPLLCEGVAQDLDAMIAISIAAKNTNPQLQNSAMTVWFSRVAADARVIGAANGKVTPQQMIELHKDLCSVLASEEMSARNMEHEGIAAASLLNGKKGRSVNTGDEFIDTITPIERVSALKQIIEMILNPSSTASMGQGGIKVKDLDFPRSMPAPSPAESNPQKGDGQPSASNHANPQIYHGDGHVMDAKKLADILKKAGAEDAAIALGYADLNKISREEDASQSNIFSSITQAAEDLNRMGGRYPGGHMVNYAIDKLNHFHDPKISWNFALKKAIAEIGNSSRYEHDEPWLQYFSSHTDQGLESESDVGYQGSYILGSRKRPLAIVLIDSSGSVSDAELKQFTSESVNMARESGDNENAPEVIVVFADTVARGKPDYITPENYEEFLKNGIKSGGRTGTSFTASLISVFKMVSNEYSEDINGESIHNHLQGRNIDLIAYFTDTGDDAPKLRVLEDAAYDFGMKKLPTILFLAPKTCMNDEFNRDIKDYADIVYFDKNELTVDVEAIEANIEARGARNAL